MSEASIINLNSTTPETPSGSAPVKWQGDDNTNPRNVSAYVEVGTATTPGAYRPAGDHGGSGDAPVNVAIQTIPVTTDLPADGDVLTFDLNGGDPSTGIGGRLIWAPAVSSSPAIRENIIPTGSIDGVNDTFTVPEIPSPSSSLKLFLNGVRQRPTTDYSIVGNVITYVNPPSSGDNHYADYRTDVITGTSFVDAEIPGGTINSSNTSFALANSPSPSTSLQLYLNGTRQRPTTDYSLSGATITYVTAPSTGDNHYADYRY